jgi:transcriptional regulator with XRE-family HTH domain
MQMNNCIRELRSTKGLTQKQLAKVAGTSQQQIQRIEAGAQKVRFDLAVRIAEALGHPFERVFPRALLPMHRARRARTPSHQRLYDELDTAGIDMDPRVWTYRVVLRGGIKRDFRIESREKSHLESLVRSEPVARFAVFDSEGRRYALSLAHLLSCQFLFDIGVMDSPDHEDTQLELKAFMVDGQELTFKLQPDTVDINDETAEHGAELQDIFFWADKHDGASPYFNFTDADEENVYIKISDVVMLSVPLLAVAPTLWEHGEDSDVSPETSGEMSR